MMKATHHQNHETSTTTPRLTRGFSVLVACFLLVPAISRIGAPGEPLPELDEEAGL